jgi:membrane protease YdiL (CAAX protease family)
VLQDGLGRVLKLIGKSPTLPDHTCVEQEAPNGTREGLGLALLSICCLASFMTKLEARQGLTALQLTDPMRLESQTLWAIALGVLVLVIVVFLERSSLASIGIRKLSGRDALAGAIFGVLELVPLVALPPLLHRFGVSGIAIRVQDTPLLLEWASILSAAVAEEVIFRGYLIERLSRLIKSVSGAAVLSCLLFALWHIPLWGYSGMIAAGVTGIIDTSLYLWRRNLPACMLSHFLTDALGAGDIVLGLRRRGGDLGFVIFFRVLR